MALGERLRHQGNADYDFGAGAEAGEEAEDAKLERGLGEALAGGEDAEHQDAEGERPNPADIVGHHAEQEAAERPAEQPDHAEIAADLAELGHRRRAAEQFGQRRPQHDREQVEVGGVERPADPGNEKHGPLIAIDFGQPAETPRLHAARVHVILPPIVLGAYASNAVTRSISLRRGSTSLPNSRMLFSDSACVMKPVRPIMVRWPKPPTSR